MGLLIIWCIEDLPSVLLRASDIRPETVSDIQMELKVAFVLEAPLNGQLNNNNLAPAYNQLNTFLNQVSLSKIPLLGNALNL